MEKQIIDLLMNMQGDLKELKIEMTAMKADVKDFKTEMTAMKTEVKELKTEMTNMKTEMTNMKTEVKDLKTEMIYQFNEVELKLIGIGEHFELTNKERMKDVGFVTDKINKLEKEIYLLKNSK